MTRARSTSVALALTSLSLGLAGCPLQPFDAPADAGTDAHGCQLQYVGDESADIELEVITLDPAYTARPLAAGGDTSILVPPQGGRVIFAGVRAKNLDPCAVRLSGAVRDPATNQVRIDTRTVNLDVADDGWGQSDETDISSFSNIPVCSNTWASTDIFGQTFKLIVSVKDRNGKQAKAEIEMVPRCDEKTIIELDSGAKIDVQKECLCTCKQGYMTGEICDTAP
jgi:hypothetical protein